MLFTLVVNLLLSCLMLLLGGWTCDALSKWKGAGAREPLPKPRSRWLRAAYHPRGYMSLRSPPLAWQ